MKFKYKKKDAKRRKESKKVVYHTHNFESKHVLTSVNNKSKSSFPVYINYHLKSPQNVLESP